MPTVPNPKYADLSGVGISALVLVSILLIVKFAKGFVANISVLLGIVIGAVVATRWGSPSCFEEGGQALGGRGAALPLRHAALRSFLILTMTLVMIVVMIEVDRHVPRAGRSDRAGISQQDLARGLRTDGLGTLIGGVFNTFPTPASRRTSGWWR